MLLDRSRRIAMFWPERHQILQQRHNDTARSLTCTADAAPRPPPAHVGKANAMQWAAVTQRPARNAMAWPSQSNKRVPSACTVSGPTGSRRNCTNGRPPPRGSVRRGPSLLRPPCQGRRERTLLQCTLSGWFCEAFLPPATPFARRVSGHKAIGHGDFAAR